MGERFEVRNNPGALGPYIFDSEARASLTTHETRDLLNAQSAEIAGLRETVKRLEKELGVAYLSINGAFLVIEPTLRMLEAKRTPAPIPNPSEIPNSSEFLVTEEDQREADRAIADGSAKLQMPETGHGITEVTDAAKGG